MMATSPSSGPGSHAQRSSSPGSHAQRSSSPGSHARLWLLAALLIVALTACSAAVSTPTPAAPGPTPTVTVPVDLPVVVAIGGPFRTPDLAALDEVIAAFEAANPDVWVEIANIRGDSDRRHDRITAALAGHDAGIDLYVLDDAWLAEFAGNGWLLPLDGYVKSRGLDMGRFSPSSVQAATVDGELVALPWTAAGQSLAISAFSQAPDQAFRLAAFLARYD
jgi:ABC-type glycerol-3-phosphate transport system substrate-binding protein